MKKGPPGGVSFRFAVGAPGAAAAHCRYISRLPATKSDLSSLYFHNLPGIMRAGDDYQTVRKHLVEYARTREELELGRRVQGGGKPRSHYRAILSFEGEVEPPKALALVREFLTENFPLARAIAACHTDTDHTHVHLHVQARQTDNRKVHFGEKEFRRLDERWAAIYAREFGQEKYAEYLAKKAEMAEANRAYFAGMDAIGKRDDLSEGERENQRAEFKENFRFPERADYRQTRERIRERERERDAQRGEGRDRQTEARERGEGRADRALERATRIYDRTIREARDLSERGQRADERIRERDRGRGR